VRRLSQPAVAPATLAALLALGWLALAPNTPDLAAQVYRATVFARDGFTLWDNAWYGGHHMPGYSLVFPPLAGVLGTRLVGVLAAIGATVLFDALARRQWGDRAHWASAWFAAAAVADLMIGRVTYLLGVAVALGALLALQRGRPRLAAALAALCGVTSPVAGLFLAFVAGVLVLARVRDAAAGAPWRERLRRATGLREPAGVLAAAFGVVLALAVAFPDGGRQPFGTQALLVLLALTAGFAALVPARERTLRLGAALYALVVLASFVLPTPMGSNATRLAAAFAGPLLICVATGGVRRWALVAVATLAAAYQWYAPVREVAKVADDPSTRAAYYAPLVDFLDGRPGVGRLEVPFTRGHWEAVHLAPHFPLARGWMTQLDTKYNELFYVRRPVVGTNEYRAWLRRTGVRYVAVPGVPLDPSGEREARLIRLGVPFLTPIWASADWTVYEFTDPAPLVQGATAELMDLDSQRFLLRFDRAGTATVKVRFSPYFRPGGAAACVSPTKAGWTRVRALEAGRVSVGAAFSPGRIVARDGRCGGGAVGPPGA
jgi:hypothetical protein